MVVSSFAAEILKLRKRPSTWVLAAVLLLGLVLLGYLLLYSIASISQNQGTTTSPTGATAPPRAFAEALKANLFPARTPANVARFVAQFGGPIALIYGALVAGSEYRWGTLPAVLTRRQSRLSFLFGKFSAAGAMLLALSLLALVAGALTSYVLAGVEGASGAPPSFGAALLALGVCWLVLGAWASFGFFLAVLFRGTALAIGLGLVYALVLQSVVSGLANQSEVLSGLRDALLGKNSGDLVTSLDRVTQGLSSSSALADPARAALVLAAYVVVSLLLSALLFRRRDVA